jgi:hypothetical protein
MIKQNMIKYSFAIIFSIVLFTGNSISENNNMNIKIKSYETCADDTFVRHFGNNFRYFLSMHIQTKIYQNQAYEWMYEDCEKQSTSKPITFNLKNKLYKQDLDEITAEIFGKCADEMYVLEFGDHYNKFLELKIRDKIRLQLNYEWFVEACEEEYRTYPIKFKLKYFDYL